MKLKKLCQVPKLALAASWILLVCLSFVGQGAWASQKNDRKQNTNYLFVQSAQEAKIERDEKSPHLYRVTLKNVSPYVTYFSDRPARKTNTMGIEKFVRFWGKKLSNGFSQNPPNADLVAIPESKKGILKDNAVNFVVQLTNPSYDKKSKTLTYMAKPLQGSMQPNGTTTFHHIFLFVDDVCLSCWGF